MENPQFTLKEFLQKLLFLISDLQSRVLEIYHSDTFHLDKVMIRMCNVVEPALRNQNTLDSVQGRIPDFHACLENASEVNIILDPSLTTYTVI